MKISVIGTGYVGLVSGVCFAYLGHDVLALDIDEKKIELLKNGHLPIYEPELDKYFLHALREKRITFTTSYQKLVEFGDFIFIAVGTPPKEDGSADLSYVESALSQISAYLTEDQYKIIVNKSTVPVGTGRWARNFIITKLKNRGFKSPQNCFDIVSNPEFLREGKAVYDFMNPDRVIIGSDNRNAAWKVASLYEAVNPTLLVCDVATAEMIKYAANSFLATKISFINEIANICEKLNADVDVVARGIGLDHRISPFFLKAGLGFGGSCLPKDISALISIMQKNGVPPLILTAVNKVNERQKLKPIYSLKSEFSSLKNKKIALWGLSFKPGTDDVRHSPSLDIIKALLHEGAVVYAHDPVATENAKASLLKLVDKIENVIFCSDMYIALQNSEALILVTDWKEYIEPDFTLFKNKIIFDGRNVWNPEVVKRYAKKYMRIG